MSDTSRKWAAKVMSSLVVVLAVAVGVRAASELLEPLVPLLALLVMLGVVYAVVFGRFRQ